MADQTAPAIPRERLDSRWKALKNERESWMSHYREISDNLLPRSGRFFVEDRNRGDRRHQRILDSTALRAHRILSAGLMSGLTSPARPWFRLETADTDLMQYQPVKLWLSQVTNLELAIFQRSNTYRALHSIYDELGAFGTAANIIAPDFNTVIHHFPLTAGEYCIATDWKGDVCTLYREFQKTVGEVVKEFGQDRCSRSVQSMYEQGNLDKWITIVHAIEPRADRDLSKSDNLNMAWRSVYFEIGADPDHFLRESGFRRFRALCPRWALSGGDIYGNSPGMEALGDIKQLYQEQMRKSQGIDYKTNPPLQVPSELAQKRVATLPGGVTYFNATSPTSGIRSLFEVNLDMSHLLEDIQDVRQRINASFYADMFLAISSLETTNRTAAEIAERHEEKLLMLGPVLERLQNELLDPLIEITFDRIMETGIVPPPPKELQGHDINVSLVSMLAQAQRAVGTNSIDRFTSTIGNVAQFKPEVLDKIDGDALVDVYADSLGIDPRLIADDDKVAAIRQQRAQAQQQAQQAAAVEQAASAAQKLGSVNTAQPNALTDATRAFSGYT